jgi:hypothetical protein
MEYSLLSGQYPPNRMYEPDYFLSPRKPLPAPGFGRGLFEAGLNLLLYRLAAASHCK